MKNLDLPMHDDNTPLDLVSPTSAVAKIITTTAFQNFFNTISNGGFLLILSSVMLFSLF